MNIDLHNDYTCLFRSPATINGFRPSPFRLPYQCQRHAKLAVLNHGCVAPVVNREDGSDQRDNVAFCSDPRRLCARSVAEGFWG